MACDVCGEPSSKILNTRTGSKALCDACADIGWSILSQPLSNDFWSLPRERITQPHE